MTPQHHLPADIERTSISIITRELDELGLTPPPETAAVVKRVIHTTADFDCAVISLMHPAAVEAAVRSYCRCFHRYRHQYGAGGHHKAGPEKTER